MPTKYRKLSIIKQTAGHDAAQKASKVDTSSKIINSLIGAPATDLKLLKSAEGALTRHQEKSSKNKLINLINGLFDIYQCQYEMDKSVFYEKKVDEIRVALENAYISHLKKEVEATLDKKIVSADVNYASALSAIAERNPNASQQLEKRLNKIKLNIKNNDMLQKLLKHHELIDPEHIQLLNRQLHHAQKNKAKKPEEWQSLRIELKKFLIIFASHSAEKLRMITQEESPLLREALRVYTFVKDSYKYLKVYTYVEEVDALISNYDYLPKVQTMLAERYPLYKKNFLYLAYPRPDLDTVNIAQLLDNVSKDIAGLPTIYWSEINPSLGEIKEKFTSCLAAYSHDDMLEYYDIYNNILNTQNIEKQLEKYLHFIRYLSKRITEKSKYDFTTRKIEEMRTKIREEFAQKIEKRLNGELLVADTFNKKAAAFDRAIKLLKDCGELAILENIYAQKAAVLAEDKNIINVVKIVTEPVNESINELSSKTPRPPTPKPHNYQQTLIIKDEMYYNNYVIFSKPLIKLGRANDNDIIMKYQWVSAHHCQLDMKKHILSDLHSTNGTYCKGKKISSLPLNDISEFTISGVFDYLLKPIEQSYYFHLHKLINEELMANANESLLSLLKTEFYYLHASDTLSLHKKSGNLNQITSHPHELIEIGIAENGFYLMENQEKINVTKHEQRLDRYSFYLL